MALEDTDMTPEEVQSVRDRSLVAAYEDHDVGVDALTTRFEAHGYYVEDHGDDARHADDVYYGDGPDLAIYTDDPDAGGALVCYVEIKCKTDPEWFGRCNLRHYREYVNFATEVDVPVFVWWALIEDESTEDDTDARGVIHREAFVEVTDTAQIHGDVVEVGTQQLVFDIDDAEALDGTEYHVLDGDDLVEVHARDSVVQYIPDVWGNEVVELRDEDYRSMAHVLYRLDA